MNSAELLASLTARFAGAKAGHINFTADEVAEWPDGLFDKLHAQKLLINVEPLHVLECRGCERACDMPVNVIPAQGSRPARAFIACDKRDDVGRVKVDFARMRQWRMTRAAFAKLQRTWVTPSACTSGLKRSKAPVTFRAALVRLLAEIEARAEKHGVPFDQNAMPGRKLDLHAVALKFDVALDYAPRTFDDYLDGLCAFKRGARKTNFYETLFPEYTK